MSSLLERLHAYKEDRGMMANLRCVFVESKKHRAWPALSRLGVDVTNEIGSYVAGFYATHPEDISIGNFGTTCKAIERSRKEKRSDDSRLTPTERRFQLVLAASKDEVLARVLRMVLVARVEGVAVNYKQLEKDLSFWNERTKSEWAGEFWGARGEASEGDVQ